MPGHDIIVIGASAGGMEALTELARGLPADLPAAVLIVWHLAPTGLGVLPRVLANAGPLPADNARDGEAITTGRIYVAPPDRHLILEPGRVRLTLGPKENRFRPAIDPLFRSAALAYGPRVVGVILTGLLDDGTAGLWAVKARGGLAVVQDPLDAMFASMPQSALAHVKVDYSLPLAQLPALLARLARQEVAPEEGTAVPEDLKIETRITMEDNALAAGVMKLGPLSPYTCPECHGVLLRMKTGGLLRFRCHTGHAYTIESLLAEVSVSVEDSLWSSLRAVEESVLLLRHVAEHLREAGEPSAEDCARRADEAARKADLIRKAVMQHDTPAPSAGSAGAADAGASLRQDR